MPTERIGVLGGAFDPIHMGHLLLAERALEYVGLDRVLFVPTGLPPHGKSLVASPYDRLSMVSLALSERGDGRFLPSSIEIRNIPKVSYMVSTLEVLSGVNYYRGADLYLILGDDEFSTFHQWREPERIASMARPVCVQRGVWKDEFEGMPLVAGGAVHEANVELDPLIVPCPDIHWDLSSTAIRARLLVGGSIRYLVPESVRTYIGWNDLYGG
jgi:nicotinate-nucleotide adenylyltransferase